MLIGYARVSTDDQNLDLQRDALKQAGCEQIYTDRVSGTKAERKGLRACLVSNRVRLGGAKSASVTEGTASFELFLRSSFLHFRSVSTKEGYQRVPPHAPESPNRFNLHLYQTGF
jgi:hypothetical protein